MLATVGACFAELPALRMPKPMRRQTSAVRKTDPKGDASPSGSPRSPQASPRPRRARARAPPGSPDDSASSDESKGSGDDPSSPTGAHSPRSKQSAARPSCAPHAGRSAAAAAGHANGGRGGASKQQPAKKLADKQAEAYQGAPAKHRATASKKVQGDDANDLEHLAALLACGDPASAAGGAGVAREDAPAAARETSEVAASDSDGDDFFKEDPPSEASESSSSGDGKEEIPLEHGRRTAALVAAQHIKADAARAEPKAKRPRRE